MRVCHSHAYTPCKGNQHIAQGNALVLRTNNKGALKVQKRTIYLVF